MSIIDQAFTGKKVLITGGAGFIGSNLARRLLDLGAKVLLVDSLIPDYGGNLQNLVGFADRLQLNISDVRDEHAMRYLVQGQDYLFNVAGQTSHIESMRDPIVDMEINCRSQLSILETCRKYNPTIRIVFASTRQIYGKPDYLPVDEKHLLRPVDVNGVNKMAGEWYHILYNNVYGIPTCSLRLTNTYGPRMRVKNARQTFLGIWFRMLVEGKPFEVWGGEQKRDYTYIDDAVQAFLLAAVHPQAVGQVFNLGGDNVYTLKETAEMMIKANGSGQYIVKEFPSENKRIDIGDYYADDLAIRQALGWSPQTSLEEGFGRTLEYYRQHLQAYL